MALRLTNAWLGLLLVAGCGGQVDELPPRGQILLFVDTDAPVPPAPGTRADAADPPWLFDRLRFEVLRGEIIVPEVIPIALRDFTIHEGLFSKGPVSIGILPEPRDDDLTVRVRLFRGDRTKKGQPLPNAVIESRVRLPPIEPDGIVRVFVMLRSDDTGKPQGLETPLPPELSIPKSSELGTWPGAAIVPCPAPARAGEACVPGGAFWMGDPALRDNPELSDSDSERLVVMSPFYIDLSEVSVGAFREQASALAAAGETPPPIWSGDGDGADFDDYATYTPGPLPADPTDSRAALPVNAVLWSAARAYCQAIGKDLPSEAMFELVSSARGRENAYVWGDDDPECDWVVVARAGTGVYVSYDGECRPPTSIGGVLPAGSGGRDVVELDDGAGDPRLVVDLAGNLTEWMLDWHLEPNEGIWSQAGLLRDPVASEPSVTGNQPGCASATAENPAACRAVRGGSWRGRFIDLRAGAKSGRPITVDNRSIGFRCARRP